MYGYVLVLMKYTLKYSGIKEQLNLKLFKEIMCVHIHPHTQTQNNKSKGANVKW